MELRRRHYAARAAVMERAERIAVWYGAVSGLLRMPTRVTPEQGTPALTVLTAEAHERAEAISSHPSSLWVALHLDYLESHPADLVGAVERVVTLRRRPWWR